MQVRTAAPLTVIPQTSQQQSHTNELHSHNSLNPQQQQHYQSSFTDSSEQQQQQTITTAQMAMHNISPPTPTRLNMATASVGNGWEVFLVDHTKARRCD